MISRDQIARQTATVLAAADLSRYPAVLGFDGFIDDIIHVVEKRHAPDRFDRVTTTAAFGQKILQAAGESRNFELVVTQQKLGGNGPIMANALAVLGMPVSYIGTVGDAGGPAAIHPVFQDFARRAALLPLALPAHTHALEFTDGKLMLGELSPLSEVTWSRLLQIVGMDRLTALFEGSTILGMLNWTMLPHLTDLWNHVTTEILPCLSDKPRRAFIDLADPQKRTATDLLAGLNALSAMNGRLPVTLGLNFSEAQQAAAALGIAPFSEQAGLVDIAGRIRQALSLDTVVVHPRHGAAAATSTGAGQFAGPFTASPKISTGAGDHFNTGFALGQLLGLGLEHALCLGTALSGYYVRNAASPAQSELCRFLNELPDPEV